MGHVFDWFAATELGRWWAQPVWPMKRAKRDWQAASTDQRMEWRRISARTLPSLLAMIGTLIWTPLLLIWSLQNPGIDKLPTSLAAGAVAVVALLLWGIISYLFQLKHEKALRSHIRSRSGGFTLVELVVVLGIMAALAAIVVPIVARFAGRGQEEANATELRTVQAAFDLYTADVVTASFNAGGPTNDFQASDPQLFPGFLRQRNTSQCYTWTAYDWQTATDGAVVSAAVCP